VVFQGDECGHKNDQRYHPAQFGIQSCTPREQTQKEGHQAVESRAPQDKDLIMQLAQPFRFILSIQPKRASLKIENVARKFFFLFFLGTRSRD
jgi:hypothetical protein